MRYCTKSTHSPSESEDLYWAAAVLAAATSSDMSLLLLKEAVPKFALLLGISVARVEYFLCEEKAGAGGVAAGMNDDAPL